MKFNLVKVVIVLLSVIIFSGILAVDVSVRVEETSNVPLEGLGTPRDPSGQPIQFNAITERRTILIDPLRLVIGVIAGGLVGVLLTKILPMPNKVPNIKVDKNRLLKNFLWIILFLILSWVTWAITLLLLIIIYDPEAHVHDLMFSKYSALFALVFSWLLVGRKIIFAKKKVFINAILLGPFNWFKIKKLNGYQLKVLWIFIAVIFFLVTCPPWKAYEWSREDANGVRTGGGEPAFVDFHYFGTHEYLVSADSFSFAEIDHKLQMRLLIATLLVGSAAFVAVGIVKRCET